MFTTLMSIIYPPQKSFHGFSKVWISHVFASAPCSRDNSHWVVLWSLGSFAVVWDNKHSVQVSIATPHEPNGNCLIRNRCCHQPDIKVAQGTENAVYTLCAEMKALPSPVAVFYLATQSCYHGCFTLITLKDLHWCCSQFSLLSVVW